MTKHPFDPIALIEIGYAPRADSLDWMRAMADPITRALNPGGDVPAIPYCLGPRGPEHLHVVPERSGLTVPAGKPLRLSERLSSGQYRGGKRIAYFRGGGS